MANKHRYTAEQVATVLTETKGMMFLRHNGLAVVRKQSVFYCKRYPSVQAAKDAQRGIMVDTAELKLWQSIQNGESWGITLCLKTIGKDRGYVERQEVTGSDGGSLAPTVIFLPAQAPTAEEWAQSVQHLLPTNGHQPVEE